jgi:uncharacterized protein YecT (DUF1311 family)
MIHAILLAAAGPLAAHADPQLDTCMQSAETSLEFSECTGAAIKRSDTTLNERWRKLMALLKDYDKSDRDSLLAEQRAWIAFKEQSCSFYWGSDFGSLHRTIEGPLCRLRVIQNRIADLDGMAASLEQE